MKRILVPCDFSKPAINAYRFALNIARKSKGAIYLIHVIDLPVFHESMLIEQDFIHFMKLKTERNFEKLLNKHSTGGVRVKSEVVFGAVSRMIVDYVNTMNID